MTPPLPTNTPANNQNVISQIDDFIAGLNMPPSTTIATAIVTRTSGVSANNELPVDVPKTEEEMQAFILKNSAQLTVLSIKSVQDLQKQVAANGDPEQMAALASLIAAGAGAIEVINKINLQNKKNEGAREVKKIEVEGKRELQKLKNEGGANLPGSTTNILIATREELMSKLADNIKSKVSGDVYELSTEVAIISAS